MAEPALTLEEINQKVTDLQRENVDMRKSIENLKKIQKKKRQLPKVSAECAVWTTHQAYFFLVFYNKTNTFSFNRVLSERFTPKKRQRTRRTF